jgi:hypothetical protein
VTIKQLEQETKPYINTLILDGFQVKKLIGVLADDMDFYYIIQPPRGPIEHLSICGGIDYLKKYSFYKRLKRLWDINVPSAQEE